MIDKGAVSTETKAHEDLRIHLPTLLACPLHWHVALGTFWGVPMQPWSFQAAFSPSSLISLHFPLLITLRFGCRITAAVQHPRSIVTFLPSNTLVFP